MAESAEPIYKILSAEDWAAAKRAGRYEGSADDRRDGFIHFSDGEQIVATARKYFAGQSDLVLLAIDPARLGDLRWERSRDGALFPHLYGPLELDAVTQEDALPGEDAADAIARLLTRLLAPRRVAAAPLLAVIHRERCRGATSPGRMVDQGSPAGAIAGQARTTRTTRRPVVSRPQRAR